MSKEVEKAKARFGIGQPLTEEQKVSEILQSKIRERNREFSDEDVINLLKELKLETGEE